MLAIARALMSRPKLLLLDEPSLGLAPQIVLQIFEVIRELNRQGMSVLLVEQNARMASRWPTAGTCWRPGRSPPPTRPTCCSTIRASGPPTWRMSPARMNITRVETIHLALPAGPVARLAVRPDHGLTAVVAVRLHTDTAHVGLGFTTATVAGRPCSADRHRIGPAGRRRRPERARSDTSPRLRIGFGSPAGRDWRARAYAAIDIALWDLKAKAAGLPLYRLLGGAGSAASCFIGDLAGPSAATPTRRFVGDAVARPGGDGWRVDVGSGDVQLDADRVQRIRDGLGESAWLGIAADGRYDLGTALAMAHFYEEDVGIDWFDSPIPVEDRVGYRRLAERMEVPLAIGSSFDDRDAFRRVWNRATSASCGPTRFDWEGSRRYSRSRRWPRVIRSSRTVPVAGSRRASGVRAVECANGRVGLVAGTDVRRAGAAARRQADSSVAAGSWNGTGEPLTK